MGRSGPGRSVGAKWALVLAATAALAGCTAGKARPGGTASVPSTTRTVQEASTDPWAVPAVITPDYVNRVLAYLNHVDGNALRSARQANTITPEFVTLEHAITANEDEYQLFAGSIEKSIADGWQNIGPSPGDTRTSVTKLYGASPTCTWGNVRQDFTAEGPGGVGLTNNWWIALVPKPASTINPTHWAFEFDGFETSQTPGGVPLDACHGT